MVQFDRALSRRRMLQLAAACAASFPLAACGRMTHMTDEIWDGWVRDWQYWEGRATLRGWTVTPLVIDPPANPLRLRAVELVHDQTIPAQVREVLGNYAAAVHFGWHIPDHLGPLQGAQPTTPFASGLYNHVFDLAFADEHAIPNFLGWRRHLAARDLSEEPNAPWMWDNQFPLSTWVNGDMLTIDVSDDDPARQPVRYFSHELEGLHGLALAPDFITFVTVWSALGCAGTEYHSLYPFVSVIDEAARTAYLSTDTEGAQRWLAFAARAPDQRDEDEPPPVIFAGTPVDERLILAARAGDRAAVTAAIRAGAVVDSVLRPEFLWDARLPGEDYMTSLSYAAIHNDLTMAELLLEAGATVNTRYLPTNAAVKYGTPQTLQWLLDRGGRVNGWHGQRYFPLADLVWSRARATEESRAHYLEIFRANRFVPAHHDRTLLAPRPIGRDDYLTMLRSLLDAGADPDARWDNGSTMLMHAGPLTADVLLLHGADVHAADTGGAMAIHRARDPRTLAVLLAHGADPNALYEGGRGYRPLHGVLMDVFGDGAAAVDVLLAAGADPRLRDAENRSSLYWAGSVPMLRRMVAAGLDPMERLPDGGTLIHAMVDRSGRISGERQRPLFEYLIDLGIDINAQDHTGRTVLHRLAEYGIGTPADIRLALAHGADRAIRDAHGRTAAETVPNDAGDSAELRDLLAPEAD